jgi:hypothetical protein
MVIRLTIVTNRIRVLARFPVKLDNLSIDLPAFFIDLNYRPFFSRIVINGFPLPNN